MLFHCEAPEMFSDPSWGFKYQKIRQSRVSSTEQDMIIRGFFYRMIEAFLTRLPNFYNLQFPIP